MPPGAHASLQSCQDCRETGLFWPCGSYLRHCTQRSWNTPCHQTYCFPRASLCAQHFANTVSPSHQDAPLDRQENRDSVRGVTGPGPHSN
jgi:hypothetical protein